MKPQAFDISIPTERLAQMQRRLRATSWPTGPRDVDWQYGVEELALLPAAVAAERTNLQGWQIMPRGGHFLSAEAPELLVDEYRAFCGGLHDR